MISLHLKEEQKWVQKMVGGYQSIAKRSPKRRLFKKREFLLSSNYQMIGHGKRLPRWEPFGCPRNIWEPRHHPGSIQFRLQQNALISWRGLYYFIIYYLIHRFKYPSLKSWFKSYLITRCEPLARLFHDQGHLPTQERETQNN